MGDEKDDAAEEKTIKDPPADETAKADETEADDKEDEDPSAA